MKTSSTFLGAVLLAGAVAAIGVACDDGSGGSDADTDTDTDADTDADSDADGDTDFECTDDDLWWIWDLSVMPPQDRQICAHVRGTGENVHVLVEYDAWGSSVDSGTVADLIAAWDEATPSDTGAGIFEQVTGMFGEPPDEFDDDDRIYLFLYEMEGFMGNTFDGYFKVDDQTAASNSNMHEMLHINTLGGDAPASDYMLSVQAHEFQHLIHWRYDPNEEAWINESMSELAMVLTGFGADEGWLASWMNDPSDPLMSNGPDYNYGVFLLFGTYLWERFGDGFIADLIADTDNGVASLDNLLAPLSSVQDLSEVLGDMALAIAVNDIDFAGGIYGYEAIELDEVDSVDLTEAADLSETVGADGGFVFVSSDEEVDGLTLQLVSSAPGDLEVRVAFTGPAGSELVLDGLTGATTEVDLGAWPAGATLWIAAANPTGTAASLDLGFL
jgi:hypothetical protein